MANKNKIEKEKKGRNKREWVDEVGMNKIELKAFFIMPRKGYNNFARSML